MDSREIDEKTAPGVAAFVLVQMLMKALILSGALPREGALELHRNAIAALPRVPSTPDPSDLYARQILEKMLGELKSLLERPTGPRSQ